MPRGVYDRAAARKRSERPQAADGKTPAKRKASRPRASATLPAETIEPSPAAQFQQRFAVTVSIGVAEPLHTWLRVTADARDCSPEQLLQEAIVDFIRSSTT